MNFKTVISALFLSTALFGCVAVQTFTTGVPVSAQQMAAFVDRQSAQQDVLAALGQPPRKEMLGTKEVWRYDYTEFNKMRGVDINETAVFEFDRKGVLLAHYKTHGSAITPLSGK